MAKVKLGVTITHVVFDLLQAGALNVDYVSVYGQLGLEALQKVVALTPVLLHDLPEPFWLSYADPFQDALMAVSRQLVDTAQSPWFSTGIGASAEPQGHRGGFFRVADDEHLQSRETVVTNITRHGRRLREWLGETPLLLENFNYHPTNAYEYICEPELLTQLLDAIGCDMLLDLSHARISANNMPGWRDVQHYLTALPLHKVREIHLSRPGFQRSEMIDLHQPIDRQELELLGWLLERTPVEAVTLEIEEVPAMVLQRQLAMLKECLE